MIVLIKGRTVDWPQKPSGGNAYSADIYGSQVFTLSKLQETLPKPVYNRFIQQLKGRQPLDRPTADAIAHAVRIWSMDHGATHFTHWFQPQTGNHSY
jgi:glutamine synthetase